MQHLCSKDFIKPCKYNEETKNQLWMSELADSHDIWCSCDTPFAHLLASIFPPGHQDRGKTIQDILERDYKQLCHSGGPAERSHGILTGTATGADIKEEDGLEGDAEEFLMAAAAAAAEEKER
ncbi:hypothetical protein [Torque teno midi virus 8]|nr:hypothetical protein [Torque teno midi virus 8]BAF76100.1 hypothetical protein [Torque teno midi virus 8]